MPVYSLKKWFFDVLLHQDSYLFFYITELKLFGIKFSRFNLNYCSKDYRKSISESIQIKTNNINSLQCSIGSFYEKANSLQIKQKSKEVTIDLKFENYDQIFNQIDKNFIKTKNGEINWFPIIIKSLVSGTLNLNSRYIPVLKNNGYIDYFHTNISPFKNPVRELFWGRLHSCDLDLTYSIIMPKHENKSYSYFICRYNNKIICTNSSKLKIIQKDWSKKTDLTYPKKISIEIHFEPFDLILDIEQNKALFESGFIYDQGKMKKISLFLLK
jgi:hypothetical protein